MKSKRARPRVAVKGIRWKRPISIAVDTYDQVAQAILNALECEPLPFAELARRVKQQLPNFPGSVSWYTVAVARELEAQGALVREERPVRYTKPDRRARRGSAK